MRIPATIILLAALTIALGRADVATYDTVPQGMSPVLYKPGKDAIIQLDSTTFADTLFCAAADNCTRHSHIVEFYSDSCGHCRNYAPSFSKFASDVKDWRRVVRVAAVNCGDFTNMGLCRDNDVLVLPTTRYYSKSETAPVPVASYGPIDLRDRLAQLLLQDHSRNRYIDWPDFNYLHDAATVNDLWNAYPTNVDAIAIIFESDPHRFIGAQLLLDATGNNGKVVGRRANRTHPLASHLHIYDFPAIAVFRRGQQDPAYVSDLRALLAKGLKEGTQQALSDPNSTAEAMAALVERCNLHPEECRPRYFAAEGDILKATHFALFSEATRLPGNFEAGNLSAIRNFVYVLANHLPVVSEAGDGQVVHLDRLERARRVMRRLLDFLDGRSPNESLPVDAWQQEFKKAEQLEGNPFAEATAWEHCSGSTPLLRGYTCGLWTLFHAVTVTEYKAATNASDLNPVPTLHALRDFIVTFMSCEYCRMHFLYMTTKTHSIERLVRQPVDGVAYLWMLHNIVNDHVKGRSSEDPQFPKVQFPAPFLCEECQAPNGTFNKAAVEDFLLGYYSRIRPIASDGGKPTRATPELLA